jgi:predicted nucleic acid-binding protein
MAKLRVYLDTSVFSAYHDDRTPERQAETRRFWGRLGAFEVVTSEATRWEMLRTPDVERRATLLDTMPAVEVASVPDAAGDVADEYVAAGAFTARKRDDAIHLATAALTGCQILVSWDYRHLVRRRVRGIVAEANARLGLPTVEIVSPPEM